MGVVDALEVVDVEAEAAQGPSLPLGPEDLLAEAAVQLAAVEAAGERIGGAEVPQFLPGALQLGVHGLQLHGEAIHPVTRLLISFTIVFSSRR